MNDTENTREALLLESFEEFYLQPEVNESIAQTICNILESITLRVNKDSVYSYEEPDRIDMQYYAEFYESEMDEDGDPERFFIVVTRRHTIQDESEHDPHIKNKTGRHLVWNERDQIRSIIYAQCAIQQLNFEV